jgi:hypothetical protein
MLSFYWNSKREELNKLLKELQQKPQSEIIGHIKTPPGILNAYREGDVSFNDAIKELREWAVVYTANVNNE